MMSHSGGCNNLMMFFFSFFLGASVAVAGRQNPPVELSSREDLVQIAGYGEEKLSTVLVSGTVVCQACLDEKIQLHPRPVSGASVAVLCHTSGKKCESNWVQGDTDEYGGFLIELPSHLHAIPNSEKMCLVKLLQLPKNSVCLCCTAFTGKHQGLIIISREWHPYLHSPKDTFHT